MSYISMGAVTAAAIGTTVGAPTGTMVGGLAPPVPLPPIQPPTAVPVAPDASSPMTTYLVIGGLGLAAFLIIKHIRKGKKDHTTARTTHPALTTPVASEG